MKILTPQGKIFVQNNSGKKVEIINIKFSEYYNPIGTTPQQIQVNVINPKLNTLDSIYFLKEKNGIVFNAIQTNESAMPLIELYMKLIPKKDLSPPDFISAVLKEYFVGIEGYKIIGSK